MNLLQATWRDLVRLRLVPVVVLLLGALVAVPLLLSKNPKPAAAPTQPQRDEAITAAYVEPVVTLADGQENPVRRRVLGDRKDPFAPAALPRERAARTAGAASPSKPPSSSGSAAIGIGSIDASVGTTGTTGGGGSPAVTPTSTPAPAGDATTPEPKSDLPPPDSITVRFGDPTAEALEESLVERLSPLPDADAPVVVYLGLRGDGKTAVFLLDEGVQADGDGTCRPDPATCDRFTLKPGETEFLTVAGADGEAPVEYELDLVEVHHRARAGKATAGPVKVEARAAARELLRAEPVPDAASAGDAGQSEPLDSWRAAIRRAMRLRF